MDTAAETAKTKWGVPFFIIWIGQSLSLVGSQLAQFALVWWVTETTGSATVLATATIAALLPGVVLSPIVGALVDRWNRRLTMIVADGFIALVGLWLAYLFWSGTMQIWHIYIVMFARSIGSAFHSPAMMASTSLMVPRQHLARVSGLNQTLNGALNIIAPPLGAFLMTVLPIYQIIAIDVLTAGFAIIPLFFIFVPQPKVEPGAKQNALMTDVKEGFQYIRRWPGLVWLCIFAMLINFFASPAMRLLPILVTEYFQGTVMQLGWLNAAWGGGLLFGGILLGVWGGFKRRIYTALFGILGMGVGILVVGVTPQNAFFLAVLALLVGAVMSALCNGSLFAVMQATIEPAMQGRVFTIVGALSSAMMPLGMAGAGPLADILGVNMLFIIAGFAMLVMGGLGFTNRHILNFETNTPEHLSA